MNLDNKVNLWVVIPTFNRADDLEACLNSLIKADISEEQILIVDNHSQDNTKERIKKNFPNVHLIALEENIGAAGASNKGFDFALKKGGTHILRLDSDTIVTRNFIAPLINKLQENATFGVAAPKIYYFDLPDDIWYAGADSHPFHFGTIHGHRHEIDKPENSAVRKVDYAWGAAMLITQEALQKTRGFDTDFFIYYEEVDFCLRLKKYGYDTFFVPDSKIYHKVGSSACNPWTATHWNRSKMLLFRKHAKNNVHRFLLILYAFSYASLTAVVNLFHLRNYNTNRGPFRHALKGLWDGLRHPLSTNGEHYGAA